MIKAIVGLGNPGARFERNRHNIGFRIVDALASLCKAPFTGSQDFEYAKMHIPEHSAACKDTFAQELYLLKPLTFMNDSGRVMPFLTKKGIKPHEILVVHDELEKSFGTAAIRFSGSARGHNGLRSIIAAIGPDFWRLRFGIGRPDERSQVPDYVLSNFPPSEEGQIAARIDDAIKLIFSSNY